MKKIYIVKNRPTLKNTLIDHELLIGSFLYLAGMLGAGLVKITVEVLEEDNDEKIN